MKNVKLYSPDGSSSVKAHPSKVEEMRRSGWKETPKKIKKAEEK